MNLVELTKIGDRLKIELTPEGREEISEWELDQYSTDSLLIMILEHHFCNGWEEVKPEDVGALTDSLLISDGGSLVYWHPNYMVEDPIQTLLDKGEFWMTGVEMTTQEEI